MARYKTIDTSPRFLAVNLEAQLLPGTFEQPLNHLLDHEIDLSDFDARFANDCDDRSKARTVLRAAQRLRQAARGGGSPERVGLTEWLDLKATCVLYSDRQCRLRQTFATGRVPRVRLESDSCTARRQLARQAAKERTDKP